MTKRRISRLSVLLVLFVAVTASSAAAQDWRGKGRLEGRVTDEDGKPVAGATVKIRLPDNPSQGVDLKSDSKGRWAYLGLRGGDWKITIEAPGFMAGGMNEPMLKKSVFVDYFSKRTPIGRMGTVEELVATILFLASPEASYINGETLLFDGGMTGYVQEPLLDMIGKLK